MFFKDIGCSTMQKVLSYILLKTCNLINQAMLTVNLYHNLPQLKSQGKLFYFESSFSFNVNFLLRETKVF